MLENLSLKQKIVFFIILSIMIIFIIYYIYISLSNEQDSYYSSDIVIDNIIEEDNPIENNSVVSDASPNSSIIVYVCGCVKENKNVLLKEGSRISDAIDAAGGLTDNADLTNINLAYILEDGEKIYVPKIGEKEDVFSNNSNDYTFSDSNSTLQSSTSNKKVNINKSTQSELETIPGIGPSTALKIINYRNENGKFKSTEEIKNVSGIGDIKFDKIKNYITIK